MPNQEHIKQLASKLIEKKYTVAVAESCTGGMLAQQFTAMSGCSKWFECGFVTYSNASKIRVLTVQANVLNEYGAVSMQVAKEMALGVLTHSDAAISASITGIAGPDGGTQGKPVGTVFIATALKNQPALAKHYLFNGDRHSIREQSVQAAIQQLLERLSG